jgi:hypothetical protein
MKHIFCNDFVFWTPALCHEELKKTLLPAIETRLPITENQNQWICKMNTEFFSRHEDQAKYIDLIEQSIYPALDQLFVEMPDLNKPQSSNVTDIWYNHYAPGHFQEVHTHTSRLDLSGIYILKLEEQNKTVFYSYPTANNRLSHAVKQTTEVKEGDIMLFPAELLHYVLPCEKDRITVSFNVDFVF